MARTHRLIAISIRVAGFGIVALSVLSAWGVALGGGEAVSAPSFKNDILPIFNTNCVFCHVTGAENGGLNLGRRTAYQSLVSAPSTESALMRVAPGDPEKSYLMYKLTGTQLNVGGTGESMPKVDPPRLLDAREVQLIKKWILAGAPQN